MLILLVYIMEKKDTTDKIAARIKQLRIDAGFTSYETFANDYNLSRRNYWRLENGGDLKLSTLLKIIAIHETSLEEFFKGL